MIRRLFFALALALPLAAADLPTPDAILDRFIEVTGGKAAYAARTSRSSPAPSSSPPWA